MSSSAQSRLESTSVADPRLLIVGDAHGTGGVIRYVNEQERHLAKVLPVTVYDIGTTGGSDRWRVPKEVLRSARDVAAFPFRGRPDVVHVHSSHYRSFYRAAFYVLFAAHVWRRPVVLHVHGSSFDAFLDEASPAVRRLQSAVFDASDRIVVLSDYWRDVLARRTAEEKLVVLPNAVDVEEYEPTYGADPPVVAFVSNHVRRKGIVDLVEAVDRLKQSDGPPFEVRIAGDGPESGHAERLAARYDGVEYLGYVSEAEKRRLLEASSIYVLPAYAEGLPIALLEGMAGGNACVSTRVGSIPEVVGDENGRLVEPGDVDGLTEALRELVGRPDVVEAMGRRNRELVVDRYSWERVAGRLVEVYRDVSPE